jgi:beta-phosphoglucomutase-like phosphatase (HAD superfamily)
MGAVRISFDLDDTLVCHGGGACSEPRPSWVSRLVHWAPDEPLRRGAPDLIHTLQDRGWEVWIYTTSYRPPRSVRRWLRSYQIEIERVINQVEHDSQVVKQSDPFVKPAPSKNPRAFGIRLHVDDSEGVAEEGRRHGFHVVVIRPDDPNWAATVLAEARSIEAGDCRP